MLSKSSDLYDHLQDVGLFFAKTIVILVIIISMSILIENYAVKLYS